MRNTLLAAVVLLTAACGSYQFPGSSPTPSRGTVSGHVLAVPCGPIQRVGDSCAGRAVAGLEIDFVSGDQTMATVTSSTGSYSIDLATGTWKVHLKTNMRIISGPSSVTVTAGSTVAASYLVDSGIRVPVPQQ